MTYEPLNRRLAILAAVFAVLGVVLGVIALTTNHWTTMTASEPVHNGTMRDGEREYFNRWNVRIGNSSSVMKLVPSHDGFALS